MAHEMDALRHRLQILERRMRRSQRTTVALGLAAGVLLLVGFQTQPTRQRFTEIDVERINVIEPDGRHAVVIANQARMPGGIMNGQEIAHRSGINGLIFFNSEGDEAGGLIFHSERNPDGTFKRAYGQLSLDRFESDQVAYMRYMEDGDERHNGLFITDYERHAVAGWFATQDSIQQLPEAQRKAAQRDFQRRYREKNDILRLFVGQENQTTMLDMRDPQGRPRLRLSVDAQGTPRLEFLDASGTVVHQLPER